MTSEQSDNERTESDTAHDENHGSVGIADELERDSETVQVKGRVPRWVRDAVNERDGVTQTEAIEDGLRLHIGDDSLYEQKERMLRNKMLELENQQAEKQAEIQKLQNEKRRIKDEQHESAVRLDTLKSHRDEQSDKYENALDKLSETLRDGHHVMVDHGRVQGAAELGAVDPEDVITELKERNPAIPERAFKPAYESDREWHGIDNDDKSGR